MKFLKRLLLLLTICSLWSFKSSAQITPQWKAVTGGLMSYFYPGKSPIGFDTLLNAQTIRSRGTGYLGEWTSAKAAASFYNKVGSLVSYNNVMYVIISNPGTNPPTNTNGGTPYYEPYNPAGKRTIKIMSLASGVNAYSILSLYEPTTLQAYVKMDLVVGENVSGNFIEAQSIDANLSNIDHLTPLAWYTVNPKTFKSNLDTTLLKNRTILVQVRYNPGVSGFGNLEIRYKSMYGISRYPNGIFVKSSILSNRDLFPLDSTYTVAGTFPIIEPSSTEYLNQIYDANSIKYLKENVVSGTALKSYIDSLYARTVNLFDNQTSIAGNKSWIGDADFVQNVAVAGALTTPGIDFNGNSATGFIDANKRNGILFRGISDTQIASFNDGNGAADNPNIIFFRNLSGTSAQFSVAPTAPTDVVRLQDISSRPDSTTIAGTYLKISDTTTLARKSGSATMQQASYKALAGNGNGYYDMTSQSVSPTSVTGHLRIYSDSLNRLSWKNSTYRRTIRVTRNSDQTIQVPFKFNPILSDSTDVFTAISLKQPRIISALPTQTSTRPIVGDSVNKAFAKLIFRGDSISAGIGTRLLKTDTAAMLSPIAHRNTNNTFTGANTFSGTAAITAVFNRSTASSNASIQLSNTSQSWFTGVASGSDFVVGVTSNLTAGGLFGVSVAGNVKIPTTPATASGTYDFLVRDQSNTTIQKIAGSVLPVVNGGTSQSTYTTGDLLYASATNTLSKLAIGATNRVLTVAGGIPTWAVPAAADSTISRTVANSYSLSGMQTKLNLYVAKAGTETITGVKTFSFGMNIQAGGRLGFLGATNSVGLIADDPGGTSYDISLPAMTSQVSVAVTNSTTVVLSSATLNSTYPNAKPGTQIICQSIIAGAVIYVKASGTTWLTVASTITP